MISTIERHFIVFVECAPKSSKLVLIHESIRGRGMVLVPQAGCEGTQAGIRFSADAGVLCKFAGYAWPGAFEDGIDFMWM